MFKVEYVNPAGKVVTKEIYGQNDLIKFIAKLDQYKCNIINITTIGAKGTFSSL